MYGYNLQKKPPVAVLQCLSYDLFDMHICMYKQALFVVYLNEEMFVKSGEGREGTSDTQQCLHVNFETKLCHPCSVLSRITTSELKNI